MNCKRFTFATWLARYRQLSRRGEATHRLGNPGARARLVALLEADDVGLREQAFPAAHLAQLRWDFVTGTAKDPKCPDLCGRARLSTIWPAAVVGDRCVRHPCAVTPLVSQLRQFLVRSKAGLQAVFCLMTLSFLLAGSPVANVHAHAEVEHEHSHAVMPHGEPSPPSQDDNGPATLHFHEAAGFAPALPGPVPPALFLLPTAALCCTLAVPGPRVTPLAPPHRPPIA